MRRAAGIQGGPIHHVKDGTKGVNIHTLQKWVRGPKSDRTPAPALNSLVACGKKLTSLEPPLVGCEVGLQCLQR